MSGCVVTLRALGQERESTGWEQGTCLPRPGAYIGAPMRKRAQGDSVRIASYAHARKWNTGETAAGVKTGPVLHWTSYG